MAKNSGKLLLVGLLGAVAGAVGGLLFAPKSGKETREDIARMAKNIADQLKNNAEVTSARVKEVFGSASSQAKSKYNEVRDTLYAKIATVKSTGQEIDKEKYTEIVDEVVESFKEDLGTVKNGASKLAEQLKKDWAKVKRAIS